MSSPLWNIDQLHILLTSFKIEFNIIGIRDSEQVVKPLKCIDLEGYATEGTPTGARHS